MKPPTVFLAGGEQDTPDRLYRSPFAADNAAHVAVRDANLDPDVLTVRDLVHLNGIGFADQRGNDLFDRFLHLELGLSFLSRSFFGRSGLSFSGRGFLRCGFRSGLRSFLYSRSFLTGSFRGLFCRSFRGGSFCGCSLGSSLIGGFLLGGLCCYTLFLGLAGCGTLSVSSGLLLSTGCEHSVAFLIRHHRIVLDQACDGVGRLGSHANPILNTVMIEPNVRRISKRIVRSEILEVLTVTL